MPGITPSSLHMLIHLTLKQCQEVAAIIISISQMRKQAQIS